jgi:hypothetical protein
MATVVFKAAQGTGLAAAGTSLTATLPASPAAGDLMFAAVELETTAAVTTSTPTGWTKHGQVQTAANSSILAIYSRVWQSGDTAPQFTWTGSFKGAAAIILVNDGTGTAPSVDVFLSGVGDTAGTSAATPTLAATVRGSLRLAVVSSEAVGNHTAEIRMVRYANQSSSGGTATTQNTISISGQAGMAEGASGTRTITITSGKYLMYSVWIKPATAAEFGLVRSALFSAPASVTNAVLLDAGDRSAAAPGTTALVSLFVYNNSATQASAPTGFTIPTNGAATETTAPQYWAIGAYKLNNTTTGALTVTWNTPGGVAVDSRHLLLEIAGIDSTSGFDLAAINSATSGTTTPSVSITPSAGSRNIIAVYAGDTTTMTFDTDYIPRYSSPNVTNRDSLRTGATIHGERDNGGDR